MKMPNLFSRSPIRQEKLSMGIVLNPENKIDFLCSWPIPETREEADKIAKDYAFMIVNTYRREIMPYVQTTISNHGVKTGSEKFSSLILLWINTILNPDVVDENVPVISPENAFQIRGQDND